MMVKENPEEEMDVRKEDLLLSFYDALMDYDVHKDVIAFRDRLIEQAILNAYDDATRQGAFYAILDKRYPLKEPEEIEELRKEKHEELRKKADSARDKAKDLIVERIIDFLTLSDTNSTYDKWHAKLCSALAEDVYRDLSKAFTYGNAQKWVNMTIKYLHVYANLLNHMKEFGGSNNPLKNLLSESFKSKDGGFHIPLDRIILKALFNENIRKCIDEGLIEKEKAEHCVNSEGAIRFTKCGNEFTKNSELCEVGKRGLDADYVTWSNIPYYEMYMKVQKAVKDCIPSEYDGRPLGSLEWENKVWLAASRVKPGESEE